MKFGSVTVAAVLAATSANALKLPTDLFFPKWKHVDTLFVFGDSYTQTGFNLTNGSPLPTKSNPLGNPPYPGWTSANGPNWVGYLTTTYNKSAVTTWNLAYGGATIDSALVKPWRDDVLSLKDQIQSLFLPYLAKPVAPANLKWNPKKSVFFFWIGINDIGNSWWLENWETEFRPTLLDEYFKQIKDLYNAGARNFVFIDVPSIDRSPLTIANGEWAVETQGKVIESFNAELRNYVRNFTFSNWGVQSKVFDSKKLYDKILDSPEKYGFKNTTGYCTAYENGTPAWDTFVPECTYPVDEYFWLNSLHPTHLVHKETARALARQL